MSTRCMLTYRSATTRLCEATRHFTSSSDYVFREGDRVFVQQGKGNEHSRILTKPLRSDRNTNTKYGKLHHADIIGRRTRDVIEVDEKRAYRLLLPSLESYVLETSRLVTPIYPNDANLVVSLLDIQVSPPGSKVVKKPSLEILEAGTGHGALTLYLARAINAANPDIEPRAQLVEGEDARTEIANSPRIGRQAVIHTVDVVDANSQHAEKLVKGFRRGMYARNVEFYTGNVLAWIQQEQLKRFGADAPQEGGNFLDHILLDLPGSKNYLRQSAGALKADGLLVIFAPSITQITACVEMIRQTMLPLMLETTRELGPSLTGGREWDVRSVRPRAFLRASQADQTLAQVALQGIPDGVWPMAEEAREISIDKDVAEEVAKLRNDDGWEMICRPKVWSRTIGGGFVGVWRKMK